MTKLLQVFTPVMHELLLLFLCIYDCCCDRIVDNFNNFNDWKKKKQKAPRLQATELKKHSGSIFRLVSLVFTQQWGTLRNDLEQLAVAMDSYAEFLDESNDKQLKRQRLDHPTRQLGEYTELQHRDEADEVKLDNVLSRKDCYDYVIFHEECHAPNNNFKDYNERYYFLEKLKLSVPIDILT